jgi:plasmid stabilization system protein ParE
MYAVFILEEAHEDLVSIVGRLSRDNPAAAQKLGDELLDLAQRLESMPYRGSLVKKLPGLRKLIHGNYLIYYKIKDQESLVEIVSFVHGAQIR